MPNKWRILLDPVCEVLRVTMLDGRLTQEEAAEFRSDLFYAWVELVNQISHKQAGLYEFNREGGESKNDKGTKSDG